MPDKPVYGESYHTLDDKYRINIPQKLRALFAHGGFLTRAFNGKSLIFYSYLAWENIQEFLSTMTFPEQSGLDVERFISCGSEIMLDGQGRLSVPPALRTRANLEKDITLIALGNKIEIWDSATWREYDEARLTPEAIGAALERISAQQAALAGIPRAGA